MTVLDTNVLSELMRRSPEPSVVAWMKARPATDMWTTAITQAEVLYGVALLPPSRRRNALEAAAMAVFAEALEGRVLEFGPEAAIHYAHIAAERRRAGRPISHFDAQIAAIARAAGATVATRNVSDFEACGVPIENPWRE